MKSTLIAIALCILATFQADSQDKPALQTNKNLEFSKFLNGVTYAYVLFTDELTTYISNNPTGPYAQALSGILDYLKQMGFSYVPWGGIKTLPQNLPSYCDLMVVSPSWKIDGNTFTDITLSFISCNQDVFQFVSDKKISLVENANIKNDFLTSCYVMCGLHRGHYSIFNRLALSFEKTDWTEEKLRSHFKSNRLDPREGIYESTTESPETPKYKLGVIKSDKGYNLIYLGGATNYLDWSEGEIKGKIEATATASLFKTHWKMANKAENENSYISFEQGFMNLIIQDKDKTIFVKLFPTVNDVPNINSGPASGTGFAITSDGMVVTNSHVINGANNITVKGVRGNFSNSFNAKILTEDKNNDLAIIQISDPAFSSFGTIPFTISKKPTDVGSSVFALGYPLTAVMGDEIKLTNGIVSSKSGFKGDVTAYQISVPLQPGNSGGPLFDSNGNLIGVVNAKLSIGENVSYAVKASYLLNLIDVLPNAPKLQTVNTLIGKRLTDQVKSLNKYVYIIEAE